MNCTPKLLSAVIILLSLSGCSANGPIFQGVERPENDLGKIYIYRPKADGVFAIIPKITISNNYVSMKSGGYASISLEPGSYILEQKKSFHMASGTTIPAIVKNISIAPGKILYIRHRVIHESTEVIGPPLLIAYGLYGYVLEEVSSADAIEELSKTKRLTVKEI